MRQGAFGRHVLAGLLALLVGIGALAGATAPAPSAAADTGTHGAALGHGVDPAPADHTVLRTGRAAVACPDAGGQLAAVPAPPALPAPAGCPVPGAAGPAALEAGGATTAQERAPPAGIG